MKTLKNAQAGFGMMEVLAAIVVMAIGVLGFAALQVRAVQTSGDSYFRSQAMEIAQDLAERIRTNNRRLGDSTTANTYRYSANWPIAIPGTPLAGPSVADAGTTCSGSTNRTLDQVVACDVRDVRYNAQSLLPGGLVRLETCQGTGAVGDCVYVTWNGTLPVVQPASPPAGDMSCFTSAGVYVTDANCIMLEVQ